MSPHQIARVAHEANRALQIEQRDAAVPVSPRWSNLDTETKLSVIEGVKGVFGGNDPKKSHEQWLRYKERHGWSYGPIKDEDNKEHPCFVPYEELPKNQKAKDMLFVAIVETLRWV